MEHETLIESACDFLHLGSPASLELFDDTVRELPPEYHKRYHVDFGQSGAVEITEHPEGAIRRITRLRAPFGTEPSDTPNYKIYS